MGGEMMRTKKVVKTKGKKPVVKKVSKKLGHKLAGRRSKGGSW